MEGGLLLTCIDLFRERFFIFSFFLMTHLQNAELIEISVNESNSDLSVPPPFYYPHSMTYI